MGKKITPRNEDYSKWYNDIVSEAGLAESSSVWFFNMGINEISVR
jgi:prolyl-tRNA synthetase